MVLLQRSERLDPKSSLAWLHSGRCVVWRAALRLLYLGQGAYFFVLVHGKMIDTDETWNSAELFPGFYSNMRQWKGWGPWSWGMHTHRHKMSFPVALGFCCERWGISQPFLKILWLFMSTILGQGISAWDLPVKHLWGTQTCFRNLVFLFIIHFLRLFTEMSWI